MHNAGSCSHTRKNFSSNTGWNKKNGSFYQTRAIRFQFDFHPSMKRVFGPILTHKKSSKYLSWN